MKALQIVHLNNIAIEIRLLHFFPLDVNKPYEVEHIETQFCEAEFAHIDDSKNIDILKGKVSSSHHFIDNLNFFYSISKNKPANTVDASPYRLRNIWIQVCGISFKNI